MRTSSLAENMMSAMGTERYPVVHVDLQAIKCNAALISRYCANAGIGIAAVLKGVDGDPHIAEACAAAGIDQMAAARPSQLRRMKQAMPDIKTLLLRIPQLSEIEEAVRWADVSLNSQCATLTALNEEAGRQKKQHGVILMLDVGDLREGVVSSDKLTEMAVRCEREFANLHLYGIGTALCCFGSILPSRENLSVLQEAAIKVEQAIGRGLEVVSGGSSISLVALKNGEVPERINHLRIGGCLLNPITMWLNRRFRIPGMNNDTFLLESQVVELERKPSAPWGKSSVDWSGHTVEYEDKGERLRAIVAIGAQDIGDSNALIPCEKGITVLGGSSDHTVIDVEEYKGALHVGSVIRFHVKYQAMMHAFCTHDVMKKYVNSIH